MIAAEYGAGIYVVTVVAVSGQIIRLPDLESEAIASDIAHRLCRLTVIATAFVGERIESDRLRTLEQVGRNGQEV